jgi:apolipoprotein N-acyltransferase
MLRSEKPAPKPPTQKAPKQMNPKDPLQVQQVPSSLRPAVDFIPWMTAAILFCTALEAQPLMHLSWAFLLPLAFKTKRVTTTIACLHGAVAGLACGLWLLRWIPYDQPSLLGYSLYVGLAVLFAVHWILFAATFETVQYLRVRYTVLPALWFLLEESRSWILIGVPWYFLSYSITESANIVQFADTIGAAGISSVIVLVNLIILAVHGAFSQKRYGRFALLIVICGGLPLGLHCYGHQLRKHAHFIGTSPQIAAIHLQFRRSEIIGRESCDLARVWYKQLLLADSAGPSLILTPENSLPDIATCAQIMNKPTHSLPSEWTVQREYTSISDSSRICKETLHGLVEQIKAPVIFGTSTLEESTGNLYNSAILCENGKNTLRHYHKRACLPFFETSVKPTRAGDHDARSITPEKIAGDLAFVIKKDHVTLLVATLICYEDCLFPLYDRYIQKYRKGATQIAFATIGNESECQSSSQQHAAVVRFRAIETRCPIVRSTNGGQTGFIDQFGCAHNLMLPNQESGFVVDSVPLFSLTSRYAQRRVGLIASAISLLSVFFVFTVSKQWTKSKAADVVKPNTYVVRLKKRWFSQNFTS